MYKPWKRTTALALALMMCLTLLPTVRVQAADDPATAWYDPTGYEPYAHGYRYVDILNWDPATDPYAEEMVASVPLQKRNDTFAATQANPELSDAAKLYLISTAQYRATGKGAGPWHGNMSYDNFGEFVFKFWQYTDMVGGGGRPTANIAVSADNMEYGTITAPVAAATNAAHKNGVLSIAEYFVPRSPQYTEEWLYQDENGEYPYAKKLVELAKFYGFDGYFINQEESISPEYVPLFRDMIKWMREQGLYIQWYDSIGDTGNVSYRNRFEDYNDGWIWNEEDGRVADSIFLNYWYSRDALKQSNAHAVEMGLDPHEVVFMGYEGNQWKLSRELDTKHNVIGPDGQPYTSYAVWGAQWYHEDFNRENNLRYTPGYQWESDERERIFFTSPVENAGQYDAAGSLTRNDISYNSTINFKGFSRYIVEKSVINGQNFYTDFNTGHGMQYFTEGAVSRDMQWSNLNLQDILPTWQWWIQGNQVTLDMDWDYGSTYYRLNTAGEKYAFPYTQVGGYNGGNSLAVFGKLQESQKINLYKTSLKVVDGSKLSLTYNKPSADDTSVMQLALVFEDDPQTTVYLPIPDSNKKTEGWKTAELALAPYTGRTIAAIGLELSAAEAIEAYQVNLGRLAVTDGTAHTPEAPTGVILDKRIDGTNEIQLKWDLASYDTVRLYRVYANYQDGTSRFVGGVYGDNYYIQTLENAENITGLEVRAVGIDGTESAGTEVSLRNQNRVSGIEAVSADNKLNVTWTDPAEEFASVEVALDYWYSNKENPAAVTVAKGEQAAALDIALEDGTKYVLKVTTINADGSRNETVSYFGELSDHYCAPYDGEARLQKGGRYNLTTPASPDWASMAISIDGNSRNYSRFSNGLYDFAVPKTGMRVVEFIVTDMDGNVSAPVTKVFKDGIEIDPNAEFTSDMFPDPALLKAIREKIGTTMNDLLKFEGRLDLTGEAIKDLTGLSGIPRITEVDLTGTFISEFKAADIGSSVTKVILHNCGNLVKIDLSDRKTTALELGYLPELQEAFLKQYGNFELDLSQTPKLENLYLNNTEMTSLDITGNLLLKNFVIRDSSIATILAADPAAYTAAYYWNWSGCKMDLSAGTPEGKLAEAVKAAFADKELPEIISPDKSMIVDGGSWYAYRGKVKEFDMGSNVKLEEITYTNPYLDYYGPTYSLRNIHISGSVDGVEYFDIMDAETEGTSHSTVITLPEGTSCRYLKLTTEQKTFYTQDLEVWGYAVAPKGFEYQGQMPDVIRDAVKTLEVPADNGEYQTLDLLKASYDSTRTTLYGSLLTDMAEADWIDSKYLASQGTMPSRGVRIAITDSQGQPYVYNATTGLVKADKIETYDVVFTVYGKELAKTQVIVRMPTVAEVENLIDAIGRPVTLESKTALESARHAYNCLPQEQQAQVSNYAALEQAEADYLKLADKVEKLIDQIGFVTLERKESIDAARAAYDELPAELKALVENYEILLEAEQQYAFLAEIEGLKNEAAAAQTAAEAAQAAAEEAQKAAEAAKTAAEEAAAKTAEDKTAAEAARAEAEAAEAAAKEAQAKAETAQAAAEAARLAAEQEQVAAAKDAAKAAEEAKKAAESAAAAAQSAQEAAESMRAAQNAQAAAEAAQAKAEAAQTAAEAAQAAAEAAAGQSAEDKTAAETAKQEAETAKTAAEEAQSKAEAAHSAAEEARAAAEQSDKAAAEAAAAAAEEAAAAANSATAAAQSAQEAAESMQAAQNAQAAAEEAQSKAEVARTAAEEAQAAAEAAADQTAEDRAAAETAKQEAEAARTAAEEAQSRAEAAQLAAEEAMNAARQSDKAAAEEAAAAAESAAEAAENAAAAAASAKEAAQCQQAAQEAQAAAEAAAAAAAEAQAKAEEAQKTADEAAASAAEDKTNAEKAAKEAEEAQAVAEEARKAAEDAKLAAETARNEAAAANKEAAQSAALAAQYAQEVAEARAEIVAIKAEVIGYLAEAQKAAEDAEASREAAEEARKKAEEAQQKSEEAALASYKYYALFALSQTDLEGLTAEQEELARKLLTEAKAAIDQAATLEEIDAVLAQVEVGMEQIRAWKCACETFEDVKDVWYHAGVDYMFNHGYMGGVSDTVFGIRQHLTRGQMVTILYRAAGEPDVANLEHPFTDVPENAYYEKAVLWAYNNGVVKGTSETTFAPNANITRAQLACILYGFDGWQKSSGEHLAEYQDADSVPGYAVEAMNWAVFNGIINGIETDAGTLLAPNAYVTRAQAAVMTARYLTK